MDQYQADGVLTDDLTTMVMAIIDGFLKRYHYKQLDKEEVRQDLFLAAVIALPKINPTIKSFNYLTTVICNKQRAIARIEANHLAKIDKYARSLGADHQVYWVENNDDK